MSLNLFGPLKPGNFLTDPYSGLQDDAARIEKFICEILKKKAEIHFKEPKTRESFQESMDRRIHEITTNTESFNDLKEDILKFDYIQGTLDRKLIISGFWLFFENLAATLIEDDPGKFNDMMWAAKPMAMYYQNFMPKLMDKYDLFWKNLDEHEDKNSPDEKELHRFKLDLLGDMAQAFMKDYAQCCDPRESTVNDPETKWNRIYEWYDLPFNVNYDQQTLKEQYREARDTKIHVLRDELIACLEKGKDDGGREKLVEIVDELRGGNQVIDVSKQTKLFAEGSNG